MLCPTNMEQAGMAEGQGRLDPSPIRLLVRQSADAQLATHAGERGDQLLSQIWNFGHFLQYHLSKQPNVCRQPICRNLLVIILGREYFCLDFIFPLASVFKHYSKREPLKLGAMAVASCAAVIARC